MTSQDLTKKLMDYGAAAMTTQELLSLVLNDEEAAYNVLQQGNNSLSFIAGMYTQEIGSVPKMTRRKAAIVAATFEINRRKSAEVFSKQELSKSDDVVAHIKEKLIDLQHEVFYVIFLNQRNRIVDEGILSSGGITGTVADPRLIIKRALASRAVSIVLAHNHPSGSVRPSSQDEELTRKIKEAMKYFDMKLLDHIIVGDDGYFSFTDEGLL